MPWRKKTEYSRLTAAGWIAILAMLLLLGWAVWYAVAAWQSLGNVPMSPRGWLFLCLGVVTTFGVGAGLMALLFYSSRHHYDR